MHQMIIYAEIVKIQSTSELRSKYMYNGQFITELPIETVKMHYERLRTKSTLTDEERDDFNICKERLISFACETLDDNGLQENGWINVKEALPDERINPESRCCLSRRNKMTELEAMGYTAEQAEEVDRIARSIAQTSDVSANEATQAICSVMKALSPLGDAEIAMIRNNPSLNIFKKWWLIPKIKKRRIWSDKSIWLFR